MTEKRTVETIQSPGKPLFSVARRMQRVFGRRGQGVQTGTTRVQSVTPAAPARRNPLLSFLRNTLYTLLMSTVMFSSFSVGNHLYLEHSRGPIEQIPYDGWSDSVYSQELATWQQDNQRVSPRYTIAVIDVDQFRDPSMTEDEKRAEFRRQVSAMIPAPVVNRMRERGTLDKAFQSVLNDQGTAHIYNDLSISLDPIFSSTGQFRPDRLENITSVVNVFLTETFTIVVSTDGLRTADQRLRSFAALRDVGYGFDVAGTAAMTRHWVISHEVGHAHDSNAGSSDPHEDTSGERMADAFSALDHIQRFGPDSQFADAVADARALGAVQGSISHYTSPAIRLALSTARDLHADGKLQDMSRAELLELAADIAQQTELRPEGHEKLISLARLLRGHNSDNPEGDGFYTIFKLNPERIMEQLDNWVEHPFFANSAEVAELRDILQEAFNTRIRPSSELRPEAQFAHQLRELMQERGTSPALVARILEHAEAEQGRLNFSSSRDADARIEWALRQSAIDAAKRNTASPARPAPRSAGL
ncbi:MAG: hypothetical protein Alpg2KO_08760 [Alphaproteobacteria bacterium]